jgi:hypothetical protein
MEPFIFKLKKDIPAELKYFPRRKNRQYCWRENTHLVFWPKKPTIWVAGKNTPCFWATVHFAIGECVELYQLCWQFIVW